MAVRAAHGVVRNAACRFVLGSIRDLGAVGMEGGAVLVIETGCEDVAAVRADVDIGTDLVRAARAVIMLGIFGNLYAVLMESGPVLIVQAGGKDIAAVRADIGVAADFVRAARAIVAGVIGGKAVAAVRADLSVCRNRARAVRAVVFIMHVRLGRLRSLNRLDFNRNRRTVDIHVPDISGGDCFPVVPYRAGAAGRHAAAERAAGVQGDLDTAAFGKRDGNLICIHGCHGAGRGAVGGNGGAGRTVRNKQIGCAGARGLGILAVEGGVNAPAVHLGRDIPDAEVRAGITAQRSLGELGSEAAGAVLAAVRGDKGPADSEPAAGVGDKQRRGTGLLAFTCRALGDQESGIGIRDGRRHSGSGSLGGSILRPGRHHRAAEDGIAVGKPGGRTRIRHQEPVKAGAAFCRRGKSICSCGVVVFRGNGLTGAVEVTDRALTGLRGDQLVGKGGKAELPVLQLNRTFVLSKICGSVRRDIVELISPGAVGEIMVGVRRSLDHVGIGAGSRNLRNRCSVRRNLPRQQRGTAVSALHAGGKKLQPAVVVKIRYGVGPDIRTGLLHRCEAGKKRVDL